MKENLSKDWKIFYKEKYPKFWIKQSRIYLEGKTARPYFSEVIRFVNSAKREKILECGIGTGEPTALGFAQNETKIFGVDIVLSPLILTEYALVLPQCLMVTQLCCFLRRRGPTYLIMLELEALRKN